MYRLEYLTDLDDYLDRSSVPEQRKIVKSLKYLKEYGVRTEVINLKKLKGYDFWEVRILGKNNTRIFCLQRSNTIYILHVFSKKKNKTDQRELQAAQNKLKLI